MEDVIWGLLFVFLILLLLWGALVYSGITFWPFDRLWILTFHLCIFLLIKFPIRVYRKLKRN